MADMVKGWGGWADEGVGKGEMWSQGKVDELAKAASPPTCPQQP